MVYRFGPFLLDLSNRELRRDGEPVKLQDQPFRVLTLLVEHAGTLVTREDLQRELWPEGTFVGFEHSVNTAVKKLRQALGADADGGDYIETIPRYGYKFAAPVFAVKPTQMGEPAAPSPLGTRLIAARPSVRPILSVTLIALFAVVALTGITFYGWFDRREGLLSNLSRLTSDAGLSFEPSISPDGALVAFASDRNSSDNLDLWITRVSGGPPVRLTQDPADDREPHFCPDGRIVFRSERSPPGVYIQTGLGGSATLLAQRGRNPQCSPDGKLVAYWSGSADSFLDSGVYVMESADLFWEQAIGVVDRQCGLIPRDKIIIAPAALGRDVALLGAARVWRHRYE